METTIRIGTRGSALALWQARAVAERLEAQGATCEIVAIKTTGDRLGETPLADAGGKRLFVKEIEDALLQRDVDVAVHSAKDMPVELPDGLVIGAVLPREEPWDALVLPATSRHARDSQPTIPDSHLSPLSDPQPAIAAVLDHLGPTPRIGTSSVRRITQLHRLLPAATFHTIRGNLDTRLRKLDDGRYDAIVLAVAGLRRLGRAHRISAPLPLAIAVPAPGQGAIAIEIRVDTPPDVRAGVTAIDDRPTHVAIQAERAVVVVLGGGCQAPIGALAQVRDGGDLELHASVTSLDGAELRAMVFGSMDDPIALGERVGHQLLEDGAAALLDASAVETDER